MATDNKLTVREFEIIKAHNDALIEAAKSGAQNCRKIPHNRRPVMIAGQLRYWNNVVRALKWSTGIAAQRAGVDRNVIQ